jgi:3-hydroxyacyl-CoA dehydrogenase / 3-hydroxy-2-methylbutyryl-CoA dehydrogenase
LHSFSTQGVVALVTGGASGLGRATVERIVRQGGRVVICDLPTSAGSDVAAGLSDNAVFAPTNVRILCSILNDVDSTCLNFFR